MMIAFIVRKVAKIEDDVRVLFLTPLIICDLGLNSKE